MNRIAQTETDRLVTNQEIADYYQVARSTVYSWRDQGLLPPYFRPDSNLRWLSEVIEHMERNKTTYNYGRKLSQEDIDEIDRLYHDEHWTQSEIAKQFKVHHSTISRVLGGSRYGDNS